MLRSGELATHCLSHRDEVVSLKVVTVLQLLLLRVIEPEIHK